LVVLNVIITGMTFPTESKTLVAFSFALGPLGLLETVSVTLPLNPFRLVTNTVTDSFCPALIVNRGSDGPMLKSNTFTVTFREVENTGEAEDAVTVIVALLALPVRTVKVVVFEPPAVSTTEFLLSCGLAQG
jgi:hypothetical protein